MDLTIINEFYHMDDINKDYLMKEFSLLDESPKKKCERYVY